jgi:hypothetical protein
MEVFGVVERRARANQLRRDYSGPDYSASQRVVEGIHQHRERLDAAPASLEALEILCSYKPDITKKDWRGRNLIREARDRERCSGKPETRQILERYFPDTDFDAV